MRTTTAIRKRFEGLPLGSPLATKELASLGSRASLDQALSRMVREGYLARAARGIYVRPAASRYVGQIPAEPSHIAEAAARATGACIQIHGAEAARRFGFTTQVPMRRIFNTSGPSRKLRAGNVPIELRRTTPRKLALAGRPAGEALSALWHLGREHVGPSQIATLRNKLPPGEFQALTNATNVMPAWMADLLRKHSVNNLG